VWVEDVVTGEMTDGGCVDYVIVETNCAAGGLFEADGRRILDDVKVILCCIVCHCRAVNTGSGCFVGGAW